MDDERETSIRKSFLSPPLVFALVLAFDPPSMTISDSVESLTMETSPSMSSRLVAPGTNVCTRGSSGLCCSCCCWPRLPTRFFPVLICLLSPVSITEMPNPRDNDATRFFSVMGILAVGFRINSLSTTTVYNDFDPTGRKAC